MTDTQKAAMEQALEALESAIPWIVTDRNTFAQVVRARHFQREDTEIDESILSGYDAVIDDAEKATTALRAALAEQPAEQEAWRWLYNGSPDSEKCFPMPGPDADVIAKAGASEFPRTVQYLYTAPQPAAVPAGYALVPVEPTQAMLDAAGMSSGLYGKEWLDQSNREVWASMLTAAILALAAAKGEPK